MGIPPIGAASSPAGAGYAGADIPSLSAVVAPIANPEFYVPLARSTALNADGSIQTIHPVDQTVIFNLSNKLGSVPNDPTRGLDLDAIRIATDNRKLQVAQDRVKRAIATSIASGDVKLVSVVLQDKPPPGYLGITITYVNLRIANATPTPFSF